jgi:hypothetical protein
VGQVAVPKEALSLEESAGAQRYTRQAARVDAAAWPLLDLEALTAVCLPAEGPERGRM